MELKAEINSTGMNFINHIKKKLKTRIWINNPLSNYLIIFVVFAKYIRHPTHGKTVALTVILGGGIGWFFILFLPWHKRLKTANSIIKSVVWTQDEVKFSFQKLFTNKEYFTIVSKSELKSIEKSTWEMTFFKGYTFTVFAIHGKRYYFVNQFWDTSRVTAQILDLTI